jgi:hypothetical protein
VGERRLHWSSTGRSSSSRSITESVCTRPWATCQPRSSKPGRCSPEPCRRGCRRV